MGYSGIRIYSGIYSGYSVPGSRIAGMKIQVFRNENSSHTNAYFHYSNYSYSGLIPNERALKRMDTQNKSKARLEPESLRYDINMLCSEPTVFYILKMHPRICVIPNPCNSYRLVFVTAQHNVDLYINLRIKRPIFAANDDCRRKQYSRTWSV